MKKVLFLIGGAVLLFLFAFYCSYSIYKNSHGCNDTAKGDSNVEEYIWTVDRTDSEETTDAVDRVETVETISKKESSETEEATEEDYHFLVSDLNGYVAVFTEKGSLYEFTDIRMDHLENDMKKRIENGIKFQKAKELFTFLESCSS